MEEMTEAVHVACAIRGGATLVHVQRLCRKFSFEAICGMISLHDQQCIIEEHDDGDQLGAALGCLAK